MCVYAFLVYFFLLNVFFNDFYPHRVCVYMVYCDCIQPSKGNEETFVIIFSLFQAIIAGIDVVVFVWTFSLDWLVSSTGPPDVCSLSVRHEAPLWDVGAVPFLSSLNAYWCIGSAIGSNRWLSATKGWGARSRDWTRITKRNTTCSRRQ